MNLFWKGLISTMLATFISARPATSGQTLPSQICITNSDFDSLPLIGDITTLFETEIITCNAALGQTCNLLEVLDILDNLVPIGVSAKSYVDLL